MTKIKPVILLPTSYLPSIPYFMLLAKATEVFIELHETYPKQTYRNRCEIYSANGKLALSVPVIKVNGNHTKTKDVAISNHQNWQIIHWRAIESAYARSPFFLYYCDELRPIYEVQAKNLIDFNMLLMRKLMELTGIKTQLSFTGQFEKSTSTKVDYREMMTPKRPDIHFEHKPYYQVFESRYGFLKGLSVIDLLFNLGPETGDFLLDNS